MRPTPLYDVPIRTTPPHVLSPALPPSTVPLLEPSFSSSASPHPFSGVTVGDNADGSGRGGAANGQQNGPNNPDDDPDMRKRDKEIYDIREGQIFLDSAALKGDKGRSRGSMKCELLSFERG